MDGKHRWLLSRVDDFHGTIERPHSARLTFECREQDRDAASENACADLPVGQHIKLHFPNPSAGHASWNGAVNTEAHLEILSRSLGPLKTHG